MVWESRKATCGACFSGLWWARGVGLGFPDHNAKAVRDTALLPELICSPSPGHCPLYAVPREVPGQSQKGAETLRTGVRVQPISLLGQVVAGTESGNRGHQPQLASQGVQKEFFSLLAWVLLQGNGTTLVGIGSPRAWFC